MALLEWWSLLWESFTFLKSKFGEVAPKATLEIKPSKATEEAVHCWKSHFTWCQQFRRKPSAGNYDDNFLLECGEITAVIEEAANNLLSPYFYQLP